MENNELNHWGIAGMKWGVRRYQNRDGSLTAAGRKRREKEQARDAKIKKKEASKDKTEKSKSAPEKAKPEKPKTAKEMSVDELSTAIKHLELEKRYKDLKREVDPEKVSRGKKFANDFVDKAALPAIIDASKSILTSKLTQLGKKYLGLEEGETRDALAELKREADILKAKKDIALANDFFESRDNKKKVAAEKEKTESKGKKESKTTDKTNTKSDKGSDSETENYTGKIFYEAPKKSSGSDSSAKKSKTITIDAEWEDVTDKTTKSFMSSVTKTPSSNLLSSGNSSQVSSGKSYVAGLLEEPKK